ncbi:hypothetical protein GBA65_00270 [Rubrobacter marinus]|uniref:Uncharacterized protein n=1 Tax=Rubrobacter marinus TaxID=2653852 RepID=A0A6G8PSA3_9ACTN|nr:hypothetical protein [Rubrobacter marinus]QIN77203.1 hypothetical protein GBA65_00270 [Rubrobacter marinus]
MDYGEIVKSAFWISLRNRYLWFFGFFAGGASFNFPGVPTGGGGNFDSDPGNSDFSSALALQSGQNVFDNTALILGMVTLAVLLVLVFLFFALVSQGALAESVAAVDRGRPGGSGPRSGRGCRTSGACSGTTRCSS